MATTVTSDCEIETESGQSIDTEANVALLLEQCEVTLTFTEDTDIRWSEIYAYMRDVVDVRATAIDRAGKSTLDVSVTASGTSHYVFSGDVTGNDPVLVLLVGEAIRVTNNSGGHPFAIKNSSGSTVASQSGTTLTWTPTTVGEYTYFCTSHSGTMTNSLHVMNVNDEVSIINLMRLGNQCGVTTSTGATLPTGPISANSLRDMKFTTIT